MTINVVKINKAACGFEANAITVFFIFHFDCVASCATFVVGRYTQSPYHELY